MQRQVATFLAAEVHRELCQPRMWLTAALDSESHASMIKSIQNSYLHNNTVRDHLYRKCEVAKRKLL